MRIHAYQETYLHKAQATLGDAFDYAINACGMSGEDFIKLFTISSISKRMENGEPALIAGKSGIEIAVDFGSIFQVLTFEDLQNMYYTLHEADITKFVDVVDGLMREHTRLRAYFHPQASQLGSCCV